MAKVFLVINLFQSQNLQLNGRVIQLARSGSFQLRRLAAYEVQLGQPNQLLPNPDTRCMGSPTSPNRRHAGHLGFHC